MDLSFSDAKNILEIFQSYLHLHIHFQMSFVAKWLVRMMLFNWCAIPIQESQFTVRAMVKLNTRVYSALNHHRHQKMRVSLSWKYHKFFLLCCSFGFCGFYNLHFNFPFHPLSFSFLLHLVVCLYLSSLSSNIHNRDCYENLSWTEKVLINSW